LNPARAITVCCAAKTSSSAASIASATPPGRVPGPSTGPVRNTIAQAELSRKAT
jgi:hypothetical protein